ncbi:hypothetical protein [Nostoc sp.]|uniref:hypothetical protein n=1 Tax=Nostoc sp. TaxID=1180 RepID=UPI002FF7964D
MIFDSRLLKFITLPQNRKRQAFFSEVHAQNSEVRVQNSEVRVQNSKRQKIKAIAPLS